MPAYQAEPYIGAAIESILAPSYPHWALRMLNDGSPNRSQEVDRSPAGPCNQVIDQPNGGVSWARNRGLELAQGEWAVFLDAEDIWVSKKLEVQVRAAGGALPSL